MATRRSTRNGEGYLLTKKAMRYFRGHYLPQPGGLARLARFAAAGEEPCRAAAGVRDDGRLRSAAGRGRAYAERLKEEGVPVEYENYPDMVHGFITMGRVRGYRRTRRSPIARQR